MAHCTNCGAPAPTGAKFCEYCGAKLEEILQPEVPVEETVVSSKEQEVFADPEPAVEEIPVIEQADAGCNQAPVSFEQEIKMPEKKQKSPDHKLNKKLFIIAGAIALILILVLALGGGKSEAPADPNLGIYRLYSGSSMGIEVAVGDMFENGFTIELKEKGKCTISVDGETARGSWELDEDGEIELEGGGVDLEGILDNGSMILRDVMGSGVDMTFRKEGEEPAAPGDTQGAEGAGSYAEAAPVAEDVPAEDTGAEADAGKPHPHAGYYSLVSYTANGITVDQETLSYLETEHYLKLNADGTGEMMVLGVGPIQLTWEEGTITTHDLLIMHYTVEEGTLQLEFTGIPMEFVRSQEPVAEVFEASEEAALGYSNWKGTMTIANTSGDIGYAEGDHAVWGIIGGTDSGDFFEIFDNPDRSSENGENLLSMWIEIQENTVFPLIGSEDSWILDTYLDPEDAELLNIKKQNGMLDFTFPYTSYNGETAQLHFVLTPDK